MDEDQGEAGGGLQLPVAVAENSAAVGGIDFDGFRDGIEDLRPAGKEIADDGLKVGVCQPAAGDERR